jgi:hypothetical protein
LEAAQFAIRTTTVRQGGLAALYNAPSNVVT